MELAYYYHIYVKKTMCNSKAVEKVIEVESNVTMTRGVGGSFMTA